MTALAPFPNPLVAVRAALLTLDMGEAGTKAPDAPWSGDPPFYRLRLGGGSDDVITASQRVDVDTLTNDELTSLTVAELVRQFLISHPHRVDLGAGGFVVLDKVTTLSPPQIVPWGDSTTIWNATAAYQIQARRST